MITFQLISEKNEKMKESDKKDNEKMNNELMGPNLPANNVLHKSISKSKKYKFCSSL